MTTDSSSLERLGYDPHFRAQVELILSQTDETSTGASPRTPRSLAPFRVLRQDRGAYGISDGDRFCIARPTGRLRHSARDNSEQPVVGDWVLAEPLSGEDARIHSVLPRKGLLSRKVAGNRAAPQAIAANIDTCMVVMGLDSDFNPRRLQRYLVTIAESGALPLVVLSKSDLTNDLQSFIDQLLLPIGLPVLPLSAITGAGVAALRSHLLPRTTSVLVGSSGAGKSTLTNLLFGSEHQATQRVRTSDGRGLHTTTRRELLTLPNGALLIDTPGMRELAAWGDEDTLDAAYEDIEVLARECRFRDCRHVAEPGCAIRFAIESGKLSEERWSSYCQQEQELSGLTERRRQRAHKEAAGKTISKFARGLKRRGGKWG